ncbi:MAG TPA: magnesium/cobalt transporter CorA [Vicinamibacteria bacterium]|nr:magnesium/cobalt transporter CorA [Vicinamibacteria bacterium]
MMARRNGVGLSGNFRKRRPGAPPGIEPWELPPPPALAGATRITCIDYSAERVEQREVHDLAAFIQDRRPPWSAVRWINVDGLADLGVVRAIAEKYHLHPLAVEDVLHVPQRPKVQAYDEAAGYQARLFVIMRMMALHEGQLQTEQVSLFVGHRTVITFQESAGDVWDPIRQRLQSPQTRLRASVDASFLAYSLIDAVVDQGFPILEHFGDRLELLEDMVLQRPSRESFQEVHRLKRELLLLRRAMWPMREVVQRLAREPHECFSPLTQTYMRDVYDHAVQVIDILETYREIASDLTDTYMNAVSNRMTEIMKVLTIIGTIFIPLTFLAGVYGMNFKHFPELEWRWAYPGFWAVCAAVAGGMVLWLRRRGWL